MNAEIFRRNLLFDPVYKNVRTLRSWPAGVTLEAITPPSAVKDAIRSSDSVLLSFAVPTLAHPTCATVLGLLALQSMCVAQMPTDPNRHPKVRSLFDQPLAKPGIPCTVTPLKPDLNFSFRFQAGYFATWPLKNYQGSDNSFFILTRITPLNPEGDPVFFTQAFRMHDIPSSSKNKVQVDGAYFFGEGEYSMDLIVVDQATRVCRKQWNIDVKSPGGGQQIKPAQAPGSVQPAVLDPWDGALQDDGPPRRLTVLMHVAPLYFSSNQMHAYDRAMLLSSLLAVLRQTSFTQVKLVAFNLDQQLELFRQERFDASGWSKLVPAMHSLQLGTVSYQTLQQRSGHLDLLTGLVHEELEAEQPPEVVLFLGPHRPPK